MTDYYIGILSGTSMDAIDAVLVTFEHHKPQILATISQPLPHAYRQQYLNLIAQRGATFQELGELDAWTAELFAATIKDFLVAQQLSASQITAIGSHGQTIWHAPNGNRPFTIQLGNPHLLAALTGIKIIADFRRTDMALGGQGAPLAPAFHHAVFSDTHQPRCIVNIGGFSNISVLHDNSAIGFDSGPGNCLLDYWAQQHFDVSFDQDGMIARTGISNQALLAQLLIDPYFQQPTPKSTGREYFNPTWLNAIIATVKQQLSPQDILATLVDLTACSISDAIKKYAPQNSAIFVCGGGAKNSFIMQRLRDYSNSEVQSTAHLGVAPEWIEACLFAWLAQQAVLGNHLDLRLITGATKPSKLGAIYHSH